MTASPPELTLVIPCYNEEVRLGSTIPEVLAYLASRPDPAELILVDDGSQDGTHALMERWASRSTSVRVARLWPNQGKGAALARGVLLAEGRVVAFLDADLSYPLEDIERLLDALRSGADLAIGGRDLATGSARSSYSLGRRITSQGFNKLVEWILGLGIPDTQCGFKAFHRQVAQALFSHLTISRFGFDVEILYLALRWGLIIERIPARMTHRPGSSVRLFQDSLQMLRDMLRIRRNARLGRYPEQMPR
ncbi:MAG: glycosyltransferase family 2 protein [Bradymonadales bacterium]|nr:glycosyltransferase family 2 protein [Bradymonadales bacterium]